MALHFIHEARFGKLPATLSMSHCFDSNFVLISMDGKKTLAKGKNCVITGSEEEIIKWLKPYDCVWVGVGSPMAEQFEAKYIKE